MDAVDSFTAKIEASGLVNEKELEGVRAGLVRDTRAEGKAAAAGLGALKVGNTKILVPSAENFKKLGLASERTRTRFSNFRLNYLAPGQVEALRAGAGVLPSNPKEFIRHSRRLARHAREFLNAIEEFEPDLAEEIEATRIQLADNDMDLLKMETKSYTTFRETLTRGVGARKQRGAVSKEFNTFDINRNQWNLSLLAHPKATVRSLLADSAEKMGARVSTKASQLPLRSHVLVAPQPNAVSRMKPGSRTAGVAWRVFTAKQLTDRFNRINATRQASPTTWRGLGLDFNTAEWYMPVPPEILDDVKAISKKRRAALLAQLAEQAL